MIALHPLIGGSNPGNNPPETLESQLDNSESNVGPMKGFENRWLGSQSFLSVISTICSIPGARMCCLSEETH